MAAFACNQLSVASGAACHSGTLARDELDVVNVGSKRNLSKRKSVTNLRGNSAAGSDYLSDLDTLRGDNVTFLSVLINYECDSCTAVRIVFYCLYGSGVLVLVPEEVYDTVHLLVSATNIAHGHVTLVVTSATALARLQKALLRSEAGNIVECADYLVSLTGCYRFEFTYSHL